MIHAVLLLATLGASAPGPQKLAAPGFKCVNLDAQACEFFTDHFAQQLSSASGVRVTTQSEISSLLGFERQKQLLGCSDQASSCLAEMAGALGVDGLVVGSVAKFGETYAMQVKILGAQDGQTLAASSGRVKSESAVLDWLEAAAQRFARTFQGKSNEPPPPAIAQRAPAQSAPRDATSADGTVPSAPRSPPTSGPLAATEVRASSGPAVSPFLPLGAGVALGVLGGLAYAQAAHKLDQLNTGDYGTLSQDKLRSIASEGRTFEVAGYALLGAGLVGIGTGAYLLLAKPAGPPTLSAAPLPGGGAVAISGVWP